MPLCYATFCLQKLKKTHQKVAYLWQFGVFFLCSPDCPKQPRTSFSFYNLFYTTISCRISATWQPKKRIIVKAHHMTLLEGLLVKLQKSELYIFITEFSKFLCPASLSSAWHPHQGNCCCCWRSHSLIRRRSIPNI